MDSKTLRQAITEIEPDFFKNIDKNLLLFAREIRKELRDEGHVVIGITGYPGKGKSNMVAILGCLIDQAYRFDKNICFIPTSKEIEQKYFGLPMYSFFHVDEASRGLHKHKWHDKVQQKLNQLYDTEREGHFLCTALIMPRFQNFTENFRNFMITYWIDIPEKGLALFYKKDEDKDTKDPWHMDENYKTKLKNWRNKRVFERSIGDKIRAEQKTDCYWFYCEVPPIPKEVWQTYQNLKKESRVMPEEEKVNESYKERRDRERIEKESKIISYHNKGLSSPQIAARMNMGISTIREYVRRGLERQAMEQESNSYISNLSKDNDFQETKEGFNKTAQK